MLTAYIIILSKLHSVQESDNSLYSKNIHNIVTKQLECLEPYLYQHNNHITTLEVMLLKILKGIKLTIKI